MSAIPDVHSPSFSCHCSVEPKRIAVALTGNADMEAARPMEGLFENVHKEALRLRVDSVTVNFAELYFMNSSCFKVVAGWILKLNDLPATERYEIRFLLNPNMHWQKRSLDALKALATDLVIIVG